ncbi:ABC transporter ATP-binding protein [Dechloromonas sp. XY25]|uniref:ABC transporter ATP-binding protein n=1 Tax=Dechloromonas hankyongensis TaxID=2908002 RepID=A0ABS9JZD3_9RHOO|nr:ABC transporter ATP-binding protein [Dechloromonas hankyongensis]MCG2576269.1 ABC transporter ATP-binding protein [Dechloromonas hankyongensis]
MDAVANDIALRCTSVAKSFSVQRELRVWRILLGADGAGRGPVIEALRDITLEVARGKIVGILGRNGAGKSTLLRLLGQVYEPTRGRIEVFGIVAGLFELGGMGNPNLTGRDYAVRYLRLMGVQTVDLTGVLDDIADFSELGEAFDQRIRSYSSGMAARLYFAVATAYQHEIYLIDELLSVGDEHFQAKCWRRMRERLLNGASGVLVTHDWTAIVKLCETACVIEDGTFSFVGPSDKAVVSYLKLPMPSASVARFGMLPEAFSAQTGETLRIELPVEILEPGAVYCAISIETLHIGIGWEIVILSDYVRVGELSGAYRVSLEIPALPLVPGNYSLNLFLNHAKLGGGDCRSWTYGNGLRLTVDGNVAQTAVRLPFVARRIPKGIA